MRLSLAFRSHSTVHMVEAQNRTHLSILPSLSSCFLGACVQGCMKACWLSSDTPFTKAYSHASPSMRLSMQITTGLNNFNAWSEERIRIWKVCLDLLLKVVDSAHCQGLVKEGPM